MEARQTYRGLLVVRWAGLCFRALLFCGVMLLLSGCDGPQSALDPAGVGAQQLATLFWWMAGGAAVVWTTVVGLGAYAIRVQSGTKGRRAGLMIIGGGAIVPTIVLTVLLTYGLAMLPDLLEPAPEGSLRIAVSGEQWWWRVQYAGADGQTIETANEIHLPVGEPVEFLLESPDVIHAFWIPPLGGKMDMIPGRQTRLRLEPTKSGIYRGVCAEYCGASHALMAFDVIVESRDDFDRWLEEQARAAEEPIATAASRGQELFLANGCNACHTIRGIAAAGVLGPDLTHVGSRRSLAAGTLPNEPDAFARWIANPQAIKPEAHMPSFGMLPKQEIEAMAIYLESLK